MSVRWLLAAACLLFAVPTVPAADLAGIERAIAKEPKYQGKPKYCLLVFGAEAKVRVWLVLDGNTLYVDRNGNGDLTQADKRFTASRDGFEVGSIADGQTTHRSLRLVRLNGSELQVTVLVAGKGKQWTGYGLNHTQPTLQFANSAAKAPIVHFDGPVQLRLNPGTAPLRPGETRELHVEVGTPGLGEGSFVFCDLVDRAPPKDIIRTPSAELQFKGQSLPVPLQFNG